MSAPLHLLNRGRGEYQIPSFHFLSSDKKMKGGWWGTKVRHIAGQWWLSPFTKPQRESAQITHSTDKKLVISIDNSPPPQKKQWGSDYMSPSAWLISVLLHHRIWIIRQTPASPLFIKTPLKHIQTENGFILFAGLLLAEKLMCHKSYQNSLLFYPCNNYLNVKIDSIIITDKRRNSMADNKWIHFLCQLGAVTLYMMKHFTEQRINNPVALTTHSSLYTLCLLRLMVM